MTCKGFCCIIRSNKGCRRGFRQKSGLPIAQVSSTLALMELKGMVRQVGGMSYVLAREGRVEYVVD